MRLALLLVCMVASLVAGPAFAATYATPEELLKSIYASYDTGEFPDDAEEIYSQHMKELMAADRERTPEGEIGALDFDPFINGQDYELTDVQIGTPEISGSKAQATVTFKNFDEPNTLVISMVQEADSWKVDDVASTTGEFQWTLSEVLQAPPDETPAEDGQQGDDVQSDDNSQPPADGAQQPAGAN